MISRRRASLALGAGMVLLPLDLLGQVHSGVRRIGFLGVRSRSTPSNPDAHYDAFVQGMGELGYVEGKNLLIEWRFADGKFERLPELAAELVALKVEIIVSHATQGTQAAQRATSTIPIVFPAVSDPVGSGFVASLARPGGNITGQSNMNVDVSLKLVELLKAMVPALSRVAVLMNPSNSTHSGILKDVQTAAKRFGVKTVPIGARNPGEIELGFATMAREHAGAAIVTADVLFLGQRRQIAVLAIKNRLPTMFPFSEGVEAGNLMSYGQNLAEFYRHAATYVDKILKGAKPADLPVEQATRFELAINRKTARAIGLTIPQSILLRADRVIE